MKITEILRREYVLGGLKAKNKRDILAELVGVIAKAGDQPDPEVMLHVLLEREKLGSTGIGEGIAIPHGKVAGLTQMAVVFGRSPEGVDFESMDGKPVHLFFLLMAPDNSAGLHLKALAKISRMLKDTDFRKSLMEAKTQEDLFMAIAEKDEQT